MNIKLHISTELIWPPCAGIFFFDQSGAIFYQQQEEMEGPWAEEVDGYMRRPSPVDPPLPWDPATHIPQPFSTSSSSLSSLSSSSSSAIQLLILVNMVLCNTPRPFLPLSPFFLSVDVGFRRINLGTYPDIITFNNSHSSNRSRSFLKL